MVVITASSSSNTHLNPVVMEPCMRNAREWKGILGAALSTHLYIDFSSAFTDDAIFDAKVKELVSSINALLP